MGIVEDYFRRTGETLREAVTRMHAEGYGITAAATAIGYTSCELRHALRRRGIACPWPFGSRVSQLGRPRRITHEMVDRYIALRLDGRRSKDICQLLNCSIEGMHDAVRVRRPEHAGLFQQVPLEARALAALECVTDLMSAADLALCVSRTTTQARNYLYHLEQAGLVQRVVLSERKVFWKRVA